MSEPLWQPTARAAESTNLARFSAEVAKACGQPLTSYEALHAFSIGDPGAFWHLIWTHCGVKGDPGTAPYVDRDRMPGAKFFPTDASILRRTCWRRATAMATRSCSGARTRSSAA